jgi:hypothetical protein
MRADPAINAWFLHPAMLDALLYGTRRARLRAGGLQRIYGDIATYARDLEDWLAEHDVPPLRRALLERACRPGDLVTAEMPWRWSEVAHERARAHAGEPVRSTFGAHVHDDSAEPVDIHGSFDPAKLTCSTANVELAGTREQWILGQVATVCRHAVELRPLAIATLLLAPPPGQWAPDWQRIHPRHVDQWAHVDWDRDVPDECLARLRAVPEGQIKEALAALLGEPVVPADWGGEINDLYTSRLLVDGRQHSAAFLLKGPARFSPMTIGHLGKNGDQLTRLGTSPAEVLVLQHCHYIRPEVIAYLRDVSSNFRHVRRYLVLDGPDTYRLMSGSGHL